MTQECEERLIADVSETKALLKQHVKDSERSIDSTTAWAGILTSGAIGVVALFFKGFL